MLNNLNMAACMCDQFLRDEYRKLLLNVKSTMEGLLASQLSNVWNTYGGLTRLGNDIHKILMHGIRNSDETADYWIFFGGLRVLQPTLAPALERHRVTSDFSTVGKSWVLKSLEEHTLSNQLRILLQDTAHLNFCYQDSAFIRQEAYSSAFLLCLDAVEQNNLALLAEIEPTLLIKPEVTIGHNRTSSLPINETKHCKCDSHRSNSINNFQTSPLFSSLETLPKEQLSDKFKGSSSLKRTWSRDREFTHSRISRTISLEEGKLKKSDSHFTFRSDSHLGLASSLKESHLISVIEPVNTENNAEDEISPLEIKLDLVDDSSKSSDKTVVTNFEPIFRTKQRSESSSSYEKSSNQQLKDSLKLWWSKLKKSLSDSQIDTVKILSYKTLDSDFHQNRKENAKTSNETLTSLSESILKVEYPKPEAANSSLSPTKSKIMKRRHDSKRSEKSEKSNDRNGSTVTLCNVETTDPVSEGKTLSSQISTEESEDLVDSSDVSFKKSINATKTAPRWLSHQRSRSDVTPVTGDRHFTVSLEFPKAMTIPKKRRQSLLEGGSSIISPVTECSFPRPAKGQSLTSFLSSNDFDSCAELDRENNHFSISEALITAIEQMKWAEKMKRMRETEEEEFESDEEIQYLKQRIRIRRDEREKERKKTEIKRHSVLLSDGRTDTTTSVSPSPFGSPQSSAEYPESSSSDSIDELVLSADEADETSQLVALRDNGLSLSMASLYSDADVQRGTTAVGPLNSNLLIKSESSTDSFSSTLSAEAVALSLLKRFPEKQLPKASELKWLVSEQDAPQRLLPLPNFWPVPAEENDNINTRFRGTLDWAPPRAQIIFNIHPPPQRKTIIAKQNYRCAGCSMKTEINYMKRFRYCEYLGKYFCQCCHSNNQAFIPGRILRKWDFSKYYVSNFSYDLLNKMYYDPLFNVSDINQGLYRRAKALDQIRELRMQLYSLKDFVQTCRHCNSLWVDFEKHPAHLLKDVDVYSLYDLVQVKNGEMAAKLKKLVQEALSHVNHCELCQMKGFICEICNRNEVIYPFQLKSIVQCTKCWACYHKSCYVSKNAKCPKCKRLEERKRQIIMENSDNEL